MGRGKVSCDIARYMELLERSTLAFTWADCYTTKASAILDDGERYILREEVMHAMQNDKFIVAALLQEDFL